MSDPQIYERLSKLEAADKEVVAVLNENSTDVRLLTQAVTTMQQTLSSLTDVVKEQHEQDKRIASTESTTELLVAKIAELSSLPKEMHELDKRVTQNEGVSGVFKLVAASIVTTTIGVGVTLLATGVVGG